MRKHIIILSIFILSTTTLLAQRTGIRLARLEEAPDVGAMIIANGDTFATWSAALRYVDGFILANGDTVATRDYARQFGGLSESEVSAIVSDTADVLRTYADQSEQDAKDYADAKLPFYISGGAVLPNFTSTSMELRLNGTEINGGNFIRSRIGAAADFLWAIGDDGSLFGQGRNGLSAYIYGNYPFTVATNAVRRLIVTGSGDVGINTLNPSFRLEVNGTVGFSSISDGSSHANIVTQDDVTGELGYRDISSIDLWEFNPRRVDDYQIDSIYSPQFFGVRARNPQAGVTTPGNGDFFYVANFGSVTHGLQLAIPYGVSTELYYRGGTDNPLSENGSQVWKNWRKLLTEDDVSTSDVTNWNTAYGWGDHSVAGYLTSEVDGSTTNEIQTIDEVLTQGNSLLANRSINVNGNQMQIGGTYAAMLARTFDVTLSSFDLSLNTADIITDTGEILLRHRLSSDVGADQDYMTLDATSLELAHRNGTIIKGDFKTGNFVWNTDQDTTGTVGQVITMSSSGELELKNSFNQVSTSNSGANFSDDLDGYSELHVAVHSNSSTLAITLPSANATNAGKTLKIFNFFSGSGAALYQLSAGNFWGSGVVSASYTASTDGRIDELTCILDPENGGYVWAVEQN